MDAAARGRLLEAVEQARERAADAASEIERDTDAPGAVRTAVREAEEALARLAEKIRADG